MKSSLLGFFATICLALAVCASVPQQAKASFNNATFFFDVRDAGTLSGITGAYGTFYVRYYNGSTYIDGADKTFNTWTSGTDGYVQVTDSAVPLTATKYGCSSANWPNDIRATGYQHDNSNPNAPGGGTHNLGLSDVFNNLTNAYLTPS